MQNLHYRPKDLFKLKPIVVPDKNQSPARVIQLTPFYKNGPGVDALKHAETCTFESWKYKNARVKLAEAEGAVASRQIRGDRGTCLEGI